MMQTEMSSENQIIQLDISGTPTETVFVPHTNEHYSRNLLIITQEWVASIICQTQGGSIIYPWRRNLLCFCGLRE